jgi:hypothetical protein
VPRPSGAWARCRNLLACERSIPHRQRADTVTRPPSGSLAGASGRELRELQQFLLYLGSALTAAGEAVNQVEEYLRRVAAAYGAPRARVSVPPSYLVVALEPGRPATLEPTRQLRGVLRLDQTAALFEVLESARRGVPSPEAGASASGRSWTCGLASGPRSRFWATWHERVRLCELLPLSSVARPGRR